MKPRDVFGLMVRGTGLYLTLSACKQLYLLVLNLPMPGYSDVTVTLLRGIPTLLIGIWFLKGARMLVSWAFPQNRDGAE